MNDNDIIELFFMRSEDAINELSLKYGKYAMKVSMNVLNNFEDSEECVNDSYLALWNNIPPQRPNPLLSYLLRIVRNLSIKKYRYNSAKKRNGIYDICVDELTNIISSEELTDSPYNMNEIISCVDDYLETLSQENRMLFIRRYWYMDSYDELSRLTNISQGTIRTKLSRIRKDMKKYLTERGII